MTETFVFRAGSDSQAKAVIAAAESLDEAQVSGEWIAAESLTEVRP